MLLNHEAVDFEECTVELEDRLSSETTLIIGLFPHSWEFLYSSMLHTVSRS